MSNFFRWIIRFLQYLSFPFVGIEFIARYLSALNKSRKYLKNPEDFPVDSRFKTVYILISRIFYFKGIKIIEKGWSNVPKKPVLFVCNHKSNLDPLVLIQILNNQKDYPLVSFVAKEEILKKGFGKLLRLIDCVFIDRNNLRQMAESIEEQEKLIRSNVSIGIFPEGTRMPGDDLGEFKAGSIKIAYRAFCPIVPVAIYGTEGKMEKSKSEDNRKFKRKKGYKVYVEFLKPLQPINFMNIESSILSKNLKENIENSYSNLMKDSSGKKK